MIPLHQHTHTTSTTSSNAPIWYISKMDHVTLFAANTPTPTLTSTLHALCGRVPPVCCRSRRVQATPPLHRNTLARPRLYQQLTFCRYSPRPVAAPGGTRSASSPPEYPCQSKLPTTTDVRPYRTLGTASNLHPSILNSHVIILHILSFSIYIVFSKLIHMHQLRFYEHLQTRLLIASSPQRMYISFSLSRRLGPYPRAMRCFFSSVPSASLIRPLLRHPLLCSFFLLCPFLIVPCRDSQFSSTPSSVTSALCSRSCVRGNS